MCKQSSAVYISVCQVHVLYQTAVGFHSLEADVLAISLLLQLTHALHPLVLLLCRAWLLRHCLLTAMDFWASPGSVAACYQTMN